MRIPTILSRHWPLVPATGVLESLLHLPVVDLSVLTRSRPVLVLAPHPDDECLGCGGLIAQCCERRRNIHVLVLTDGAGSHPRSASYPPSRLVALRQAETIAAMAKLGLPAERVAFLGLPDGRAPRVGGRFKDAARRIADMAQRFSVATICTTWVHDPHRDHVAAYRLGVSAAKAVGARLLSYPIWGWTLGERNRLPRTRIHGMRLDVSGHIAAKRAAIACYRSQVSDLIDDDASGFRLAPEFLALFERPFEVFVEEPIGIRNL